MTKSDLIRFGHVPVLFAFVCSVEGFGESALTNTPQVGNPRLYFKGGKFLISLFREVGVKAHRQQSAKRHKLFSQGSDFQRLYRRGWEHSVPFGSAPLPQCFFQARLLLGGRTLKNHSDSQLLYKRG